MFLARTKMNKTKIEKMVENAWKMFRKYYDYKASEYSKSPNNKEEPKDSHWICWNESDLMVQFARFFYKELDKISSNIEMHFDKNLNYTNFKDYSFKDELPKLKKRLRGRSPKVDLIITPEDCFGPFLMCAEAKYFHCSVESISRHTQTMEKAIEKDIETLSKIKESGIAENVAFIIFDDYYYLNEPEKGKEIENLSKSYNKEIKILYHNSRAKMK